MISNVEKRIKSWEAKPEIATLDKRWCRKTRN